MEFTDLLFNLFSGELSYSFDGTIVEQVGGGGGWVGNGMDYRPER